MVNAVQNIDPQRLEALGPAERIVTTLTSHTDHMVHNRPGSVYPDLRTNIGARWAYALWKQEGDQKVVYERLPPVKVRKGQARPDPLKKIGVLQEDMSILEGNRVVGRFQDPGLYPEAVAWVYKQIAEVWKMDNEFSAHLASWSFAKDHRDLKCVMAAFMLVQSRSGEPVIENGKVSFHDDDFRAVGEAMVLLRGKDDINPKMLLRIGEILKIPAVAQINRELGFGKSARNPAMGRYPAAVTKWLRSKEHNPKLLEGLVKAGFKETVKELARSVGYKPESPLFYQTLRWKQKQAKDGRRAMAIGAEVKKAESWDDLSEADICKRIVQRKMNYKGVVGLIPAKLGLTRAIMAAVIEAGKLSDADLIILTPTLEDLGLLTVPDIKARWDKATANATNQRAMNVAKRVKSEAVVEKLQEASDKATAKALEEVTKNLRVYVVVDKCVVGSTLIPTEYGLVPIGDFAPKVRGGVHQMPINMTVASRDGQSVADTLFLNGVKPVRYLTTEKGFRLGASMLHPVLVLNPENQSMNWKLTKDVTTGEFLVLRRGTECFGQDTHFKYKPKVPYQPHENRGHYPQNMSSDLARWLGHMIAEGRLKDRPSLTEFVNSDKECVEDFVSLTQNLFGLQCYRGDRRNATVVGVSSESLHDFLAEVLNVRPCRSRDKEVPARVLRGSKETQREFLRSYSSGDGGFYSRERGTLGASSASYVLMSTIQVMLLNFGILSSLKSTRSSATNGSGLRRDYWRIRISGEDRQKFLDRIGFSSSTKHAKVQEAVSQTPPVEMWKTRWDYVPSLQGGRIHRLPLTDFPEINQGGFLLDAVEAIEETEEEVFDIHVPGDHSFIGNGFVNHNSGSMQQSLDAAKSYLTKFLGGFPLDKTHVSVFNSMGAEIKLKAGTAAAVEQAFKGHSAGGGTSYAEGLRAIAHNKPLADEDVLVIFVGDEGDYYTAGLVQVARGLNPVAFGLLKVPGENGSVVTQSATLLGIPCFRIEEGLFNDPYTITRTLRNLIATTPVGKGNNFGAAPAKPRKSLIQEVLETPLLQKPAWAA